MKPENSLNTLFQQNQENKIVLPDFQRDLEWKIEKQKSLLSSYLVNLPIGSFLLIEGNKDDFPARAIGINNKHVTPKSECYYLLDGQQRFTSLKVFFSDFFSDTLKWENIWDDLYSQLRTRWFLKVESSKGSEDFFGYKDLSFDETKILKSEPSYLVEFIVVKKINKRKNAKSDWFNPGYSPKDDNGNPLSSNKKKLDIAKKSAEEKLIPLYPLFNSFNKNPNDKLIDKTLTFIARNRVDEIKAELEEYTTDDRKLKIKYYLKNYEEYDLDSIDEDDEEDLWKELSYKWQNDVKNYLHNLLKQNIPKIILPSDEIARGIAIFTSINEGGQKLSTYDLIVAKAAKTMSESLTTYIRKKCENDSIFTKAPEQRDISWNGNNIGVIIDNKLSDKLKYHYLNMLSILSNSEYGRFNGNTKNNSRLRLEHLKAKMHLSLSHEDIKKNTDETIKSILRAYAFLQIRCGVIDIDSFSYQLMLIPIAYIFRKDNNWKNKEIWDKIEFWYWVSIFSGSYREAQNDRCIRDTSELFKWVTKSNYQNPFKYRRDNIFKETNYSDINTLLLESEDNAVPTAIYNGIMQYILSNNPKDLVKIDGEHLILKAWEFNNGKKISTTDSNGVAIELELSIEDHHIFPLAQATKIGQSSSELRKDKLHILNSPLNRTFITSFSNAEIRSRNPKDYLEQIDNELSFSHLIPRDFSKDYIYKKDENAKQDYRKLLEKRFETIEMAISNELDRLIQ